ncbi:protein TIFY 10b-like [Chenopodium quinoa]|uniref:Protein TIFY n=1 Tax=Chenopodium quinoa TaxID=63459 RepID=A0A803M8R5_CHEQI|nr:protein TIFY 10b-like [Chenopodium quinoa]
MSASSAMGDSGRFSGNKMSFSQTCNLLSQYVKEKRALGVDSRGPSTMNLFPVSGKQGTAAAEEDSNGCVGKTINLFPQLSGFNSSGNKRASPEPPTPQMTIFYGGQVLVFNDLPADKAKEVMDLASSFEASQKKSKVETTNSSPSSPVAVPVSAQNTKSNLNSTLNSNQNLTAASKFGKNVILAAMPRVSDLPITRKASLHRFLEKRKDRLVGKLPADVANGGSAKPAEGKAAWLGLNSVPVFQMQKQQQP